VTGIWQPVTVFENLISTVFEGKKTMGMIRIQMSGSFPEKKYETCAINGGHVCAVKRSIEFLAAQLGEAVVNDANCTIKGIAPPNSPLGKDA
jgi:hypothetical protein